MTKDKRSQVMARINSKNTSPEIIVRRWLHRHGFRFRIHRKDLPGNPDIVLPKYKAVIFVNGCFWHQHLGCKKAVLPKSNQSYWIPKLEKNISSQRRSCDLLCLEGWRVLILWECEIKKTEVLESLINDFLKGDLNDF